VTSTGNVLEPVPARMLNELTDCARLYYLDDVAGEWVEGADTVDGRRVHRWVDRPGPPPVSPEPGPGDELHARSVSVGSREPPTIARYALQSAVPPRVTETIWIAERARQALIKWSDGMEVFAGKDQESVPLAGHRHAYYLPVDDDGDGVLDHLIIAARDGFDPKARVALEGVRRLWGHGGHDLALTLIGLGPPADFDGPATGPGSPALASSPTWESRTPFVLPRHVKRRGGRIVHGPEDQLRWCLRAIGLPEPVRVEPMVEAPGRRRWWTFRRMRHRGGGARGTDEGRGFRLCFAEPVSGPIAVGYASHLGLGLFVAV